MDMHLLSYRGQRSHVNHMSLTLTMEELDNIFWVLVEYVASYFPPTIDDLITKR